MSSLLYKKSESLRIVLVITFKSQEQNIESLLKSIQGRSCVTHASTAGLTVDLFANLS